MKFSILSTFLLLSGCVSFTLTDITTGVSAGRVFDDGAVFNSGKTQWSASVTGHYMRDK